MTYEILNAMTTNTLASFREEAEAVRAYEELAASDPVHAGELAVLAFNDEGEAAGLIVAPRVAQLA